MISGEADGQEQSKGLSKCITSSRASQFRLYANQMSYHLLRQEVCTPLNMRTASFSQGASLRQREIRTHARQALACNEVEKTCSGVHLSGIWVEIQLGPLGCQSFSKNHFFSSLDRALKHPDLSDLWTGKHCGWLTEHWTRT